MKKFRLITIVALGSLMQYACSGSDVTEELPIEVIEPPVYKVDRVPCVDDLNTQSPYPIRYDYNAQEDIIPTSKVLDCSMIPIGSPKTAGYEIYRDPTMLYNNKPSYRFKMISDRERRVELQNLYVTQEDIDEAGLTSQQVSDYQRTHSLYKFGKGEVKKGETATYEYGLYLPEKLKDMTGIITQWHGMPDRTTIVTPANDTMFVPHDEFVKDYLSRMYFKSSIGYDSVSNQPNGYILDSGGNPPMALRVRNGYLYLIARIDRARVTNDRGPERVHIYPPSNWPESATSPLGTKSVYSVYAEKLEDLPIEEWIDMKFVVRWSDFAEDGSGILDKGNVKLYMNGELKADWTGFIGNNDKHGTYFKYGLYVPGPNGLEVRVGDFKQTRN